MCFKIQIVTDVLFSLIEIKQTYICITNLRFLLLVLFMDSHE